RLLLQDPLASDPAAGGRLLPWQLRRRRRPVLRRLEAGADAQLWRDVRSLSAPAGPGAGPGRRPGLALATGRAAVAHHRAGAGRLRRFLCRAAGRAAPGLAERRPPRRAPAGAVVRRAAGAGAAVLRPGADGALGRTAGPARSEERRV